MPAGKLASACFEGTIRHRRHGPKDNHFSYPLFMAYLDLAELDEVFSLSLVAQRPTCLGAF